ncbi:DUF5412 domain-containing protein [Solibacillus sp. MA9]|uniref:DUF5412 domain-containing protein n=1 Tax=Solibacillus palustris TaxID=2908203 RepID=A0ABS9UAW6_9BACL|nr:DUF5412 domain-containing protein [Solibacillus sp. MA9]
MALVDKKARRKKFIRILLMVSALFLGVVGYAIYWAFFDMNRLPKGEYLTEAISPDGTYTVKSYVNSPSLSADAVRGEIIFNKKNGKTKNIYWNYRESRATIEWLDHQTVVINGHKLQVPNEKFDWRRE